MIDNLIGRKVIIYIIKNFDFEKNWKYDYYVGEDEISDSKFRELADEVIHTKVVKIEPATGATYLKLENGEYVIWLKDSDFNIRNAIFEDGDVIGFRMVDYSLITQRKEKLKKLNGSI